MKWYRLATVLLLTSCRGLKPLPPQLSRMKSSAAKTRGQISMRSSPLKKGVMVHRDAPLYKPRGEAQRAYVDHLNDPKVNVLLGVGPAGTGKTLFACSTAVQELRRGGVSKIVLTRPVVPVEEDIGHLPGTLNNKMHPWTRPIFDILEEFYSTRDIEDMLRDGVIEISPLAFMRGRTFKRAFVIAEASRSEFPSLRGFAGVAASLGAAGQRATRARLACVVEPVVERARRSHDSQVSESDRSQRF